MNPPAGGDDGRAREGRRGHQRWFVRTVPFFPLALPAANRQPQSANGPAILLDQMEEESSEDTDYWLPRAQIDVFKENGADPELIRMLESAIGDNEDIEIAWEKSS